MTSDLVNVVLKDMNVPSVLGANSSNWDTIDCDGCYYFNSDRVVDLREEYLKEYEMLQPGPTSVTSTWVVEDEISEDLLDLFDKLCDGELNLHFLESPNSGNLFLSTHPLKHLLCHPLPPFSYLPWRRGDLRSRLGDRRLAPLCLRHN